MPNLSKNGNPGLRQTDFEREPVFRLLCDYFDGDRDRAIAEVTSLMNGGKSLREACEMVIASNGFENSFY